MGSKCELANAVIACILSSAVLVESRSRSAVAVFGALFSFLPLSTPIIRASSTVHGFSFSAFFTLCNEKKSNDVRRWCSEREVNGEKVPWIKLLHAIYQFPKAGSNISGTNKMMMAFVAFLMVFCGFVYQQEKDRRDNERTNK